MRLPRIALLAGLLPLGGCLSGLLYTHTYTPLTTNFSQTPVFTHKTETGESDVRDLRIPWPVSMDGKWHSNAIGDAAKREGIEEICYADVEHLGVFFNVGRQDTVHVYGKAAKAALETTPAPENPPKDPGK